VLCSSSGCWPCSVAAALLRHALAGISALCWLYAGPRLLLRLELQEFNLGER